MSTISSGTTLTTALVQTGDTTGDLVIKTGSSNTTALTISGTDQSVTFAGAVNVASSSFANGSASAPSITFTGDTNTGIFSPAADTIGFTEGGTESMRIDSSGNVMVGRTSVTGTNCRLNVQLSGTTASGYTAATNAGVSLDCGTATNGVVNLVGGGELGVYRSNSSGAYDVGIGFGTNAARILRFDTAATERLRITAAGAISVGSSGTATGTSGQVLTSAGSGSPPTWSDVSVTTAAVLAATAGASLGAVGAYSWLWTTTTGAVTAGSTIAGSNLRYAGFQTGASGDNNNSDNSLSGNGGTPSGTWRVMGRGAQTNYSVFLALRIS